MRTSAGAAAGTVQLDDAIFGIEPNLAVLHQVVTAQLAAARAGTQSTKTRSEVRGGGKKPWRQKGTGRARQGSSRSPQWTGGGVALGPKPRSYRQKTPKKMVQLALRSALSDRAREGRVAVVESWAFDEPKTRLAREALGELGWEGKVLVVVGPHEEAVIKSFRNLPDVQQRLGRVHTRHAAVRDRCGGCMSDARDIIIRPIVSEKSYGLLDAGVYTFVVAPDANKLQIREAVESIFNVRVTKVNTLNRKGKRKRNRRTFTFGKRSDTKRAIVTLAAGDRIELFES